MIASSVDGRTYLVDWGSAHLGPVGLDLANCIESLESSAWHEYWNRVELFGHRATPTEKMRHFYVGKAYVNVYYLPYAITVLPNKLKYWAKWPLIAARPYPSVCRLNASARGVTQQTWPFLPEHSASRHGTAL